MVKCDASDPGSRGWTAHRSADTERRERRSSTMRQWSRLSCRSECGREEACAQIGPGIYTLFDPSKRPQKRTPPVTGGKCTALHLSYTARSVQLTLVCIKPAFVRACACFLLLLDPVALSAGEQPKFGLLA